MRTLPSWQRWTIFLCTALLMVGLVSPVRSQSATLLSVQPPETRVPVGNSFHIDLVVINGADVNAFDLTLLYDPEIIILSTWAFGDYLSNLWVINQDHQPGSLRVAAAQLATPPVSGDGVLLTVNFQAVKAGETPLIISRAEFAGGSGSKIDPERLDGVVIVTLEPTFTPTATKTRTPSVTLTPSSTFTPTATQTMQTTLATRALTATATRATTDNPPPAMGITRSSTAAPVGWTAAHTPGPETLTGHHVDAVETARPGPVDTLEPDDGLLAEGAGWLEGILWGVLIAAGLAILSMFFVILRRKSRRKHPKKEDLLL